MAGYENITANVAKSELIAGLLDIHLLSVTPGSHLIAAQLQIHC